jgi:hypothetical protein
MKACQFPIPRVLPPGSRGIEACGAEASYEGTVPYLSGIYWCAAHRAVLDSALFDSRGLREIPSAAGHFARLANALRTAVDNALRTAVDRVIADCDPTWPARLDGLIQLAANMSVELPPCPDLDTAIEAAEAWLESPETEASA